MPRLLSFILYFHVHIHILSDVQRLLRIAILGCLVGFASSADCSNAAEQERHAADERFLVVSPPGEHACEDAYDRRHRAAARSVGAVAVEESALPPVPEE